MATDRESTLRINRFLGASRVNSSPTEAPSRPYSLKNLFSPAIGELALLKGVKDLNASVSLPGVTEIKHADFIRGFQGTTRLAVVFDHGTIPTPSAPTVTKSGASGYFKNTYYVKIAFVGMGGEGPLSPVTSLDMGAGGGSLVVSYGSALPDGVVSINVYISGEQVDNGSVAGGDGSFTLVGSQGVSSQTYATGPWDEGQTTFPSDWVHARAVFDSMTITPTTGGDLVPGKTYFFAVAPAISDAGYSEFEKLVVTNKPGKPTTGTLTNPTGAVLSFTLPEGYSAVDISLSGGRLDYRSATSPYNWTSTATTSFPCWLFIGETQDSLLLVGTSSTEKNVTRVFSATEAFTNGVTVYRVPRNVNVGAAKSFGGQFSVTDYADAMNRRQLYFAPNAQFSGYSNNWAGASYSNGDEFTPAVSGLGCYIIEDLDLAADTYWQVMPIRGATLFDNQGSDLDVISASVYVPYSDFQMKIFEGRGLRSVSFKDRLFFANGYQTPFYTDGCGVWPILRKANTPPTPITDHLAIFQNQLILCGGGTTYVNAAGAAFYSEASDEEDFAATQGATASYQFFSINGSASDEFVGFGIASYNLSTTGPVTQLVLGKTRSYWLWQGASQAAQEIAMGAGFVSPKCFVNTPQGPMFVGRDGNLYLISGNSNPVGLGEDFASIIAEMDASILQDIETVFHEGHVKIAYKASSGSSYLDRQIWCDLRPVRGTPRFAWCGPHEMKEFAGHEIAANFDSVKECRIAWRGTKLYRHDVENLYTNDSADMVAGIEFNDMDLSASHFMKLLTRVYVDAQINANVTASAAIEMSDVARTSEVLNGQGQSTNLTISMPFTAPAPNRRLFQTMVSSRVMGRNMRPTLSFTTNADLRIYDISFLFDAKRRRNIQ